MSEASTALDARARHWILDAAVGAAVALGVITVAHAALPDRPPGPLPQAHFTAARIAPAPSQPAPPADLIAFQAPVPGEEIISPFGLRQLPWEENGRLHEGVDIAAELGAPVRASADGVIVRAGNGGGYGRFVEIAHAEGLTTLYAHMGAVAEGLRPGVAVTAGTPVGRIGSSGTSTGPHLHFEVRDARERPLNPALFVGKSFATADDLPLSDARRFSRRVRIAYVSRIPDSKKALMEAKLDAKLGKPEARDAAAAGRNAAVTVYNTVDGRPRATIRFSGDRRPVPPMGAEPIPVPPSLGGAAQPVAPAAPAQGEEAVATAQG